MPANAYEAYLESTQATVEAAVKDTTGYGAYGQVGYFVVPKRLELAARFDWVDANKDVDGARVFPGFGATYYIFANNLKVQLMYRIDVTTGVEKSDATYIPTGHDLFLMLQASI